MVGRQISGWRAVGKNQVYCNSSFSLHGSLLVACRAIHLKTSLAPAAPFDLPSPYYLTLPCFL